MLLAEVFKRRNIFAAKQLSAYVTEQNLSRVYLNPPGVRKLIVSSGVHRIW